MNATESNNEPTERFLEIIESHKGIIFKVANSYCRDRERQKDLIQEIIFQLWRSRDRYDDQFAVSTWVYRVALNVSISDLRKTTRQHRSAIQLNDAIEIIDQTEDSDGGEALEQLQQFISELNEMERALILLYLDQKSHKEISEILGFSTTNVATKIGRVKKKLKLKFEKGNQNDG